MSHKFHCVSCGAEQEYKPGTIEIVCPYCGAKNAIPLPEVEIEELDIESYINEAEKSAHTIESLVVKCPACKAESTLPENTIDMACPFCGTQIKDAAKKNKLIAPTAVLPFKISKREAYDKFRLWLNNLKFAPGKLKRYANMDGALDGVYIPYWTYDADTFSAYTGQRGDYYYVTETYMDKDASGRPVQKERQVRKIRWSFAAGSVSQFFNDILILASNSLPQKIINRLEPWELASLLPYKDEFVSGFRSEAYQMSLANGLTEAKGIMDGHIRTMVHHDIGGDEQRIFTLTTKHSNITFKHILLPVWINAYRFQEKVFRFLINGRTGEVQGERPYSFWKIIGLIAAIVGGIALAGWIFSLFKK